MIKATAIGFLGNDCNVNTVNGKSVINFSLAHTEKFKDAQGVQREKTIWLNCAYWTDRTAIAPYLKKGTLVYVEGQPEPTTYMDRQGKPQVDFKVRINQVQLLGGNKDSQNNSSQQSNSNVTADEITEPINDLPF